MSVVLVAALSGVAVGVAAWAVPASAHGGGTPVPDAAYYRTALTGVVPAPAGVAVRVDPAGEWVELSYTGPGSVIVYGYLAEPYLRVTSTGVDENSLSPSTYLNRSLFADSVPTGAAAADVAPAWHRIGSTGRVQWHDHRLHWMGRAQPPAVAADPRRAHEVGTWVMHATADGAPFEVRGTLRLGR